MRTTARPKLFRDPVHDIISFDQNDEAERVVLELIGTSTFQRLRRIRQLGFAYMVYHGAEHSRFSHSLGVAHTARRMFDAIHPQGEFSQEERVEVLCAALLHDIGHGPFSHAIEQVTNVHHEYYTERLIHDSESDIHQVLASFDSTLPTRLAAYFGPREAFPKEKMVLRDIVSSQLDADRQDYILRDGLMTGVRIGVYDFERIQTMFEIYQSSARDGSQVRRLAVSVRAKEAVEDYLIARFHMFKQVYLHKAVRAAEKMLEAVFGRASQLHQEGYAFSSMVLRPELEKLLSGERLGPQEFVSLDDHDVWTLLKAWSLDDDVELSMLSKGLLNRDLYKTIDLDKEDPVLIARTIDRAQEIAREQGLDPRYTVLTDRAQDTPYKPYDPQNKMTPSHIPIIARDGSVAPIEHHSDLIHLLGHDSYKIWRLCVPARIRDKMSILGKEPTGSHVL